MLESFHGKREAKAVETAWPYLGHKDRFLRHAARVAIEWQDATAWRERALAETAPLASINALVALARVSSRDEFHRKASDPAADPALQGRILKSLARIQWSDLTETERLELLRAYALCFTRLGRPSEADRAELLARMEQWFPGASVLVNEELCQLLVFLQSAKVAKPALELVRRAPTQEEQLAHIKSLRMLTNGWTTDLRRQYFGWFHRAAKYRGGASFAGFVAMVKADAVASLSEREKEELKEVLEAAPAEFEDFYSALAGRTNTTEWTVNALAPSVETELHGRNFERGRNMFGAVACFQCHRIAGEGGAVGPDLTLAAGRFSALDLLESVIEPSKAVSDLYGNVVIAKKDGEVVTGRIVYHLHDDAVNVNPDMFNPASTVRVDRKEILEIRPSPISPMPASLLAPLTREEILDLLAFVLSGGNAAHSMFQLADGAANGIK
jgi:putative heme-binding domain-containing protein